MTYAGAPVRRPRLGRGIVMAPSLRGRGAPGQRGTNGHGFRAPLPRWSCRRSLLHPSPGPPWEENPWCRVPFFGRRAHWRSAGRRPRPRKAVRSTPPIARPCMRAPRTLDASGSGGEGHCTGEPGSSRADPRSPQAPSPCTQSRTGRGPDVRSDTPAGRHALRCGRSDGEADPALSLSGPWKQARRSPLPPCPAVRL